MDIGTLLNAQAGGGIRLNTPVNPAAASFTSQGTKRKFTAENALSLSEERPAKRIKAEQVDSPPPAVIELCDPPCSAQSQPFLHFAGTDLGLTGLQPGDRLDPAETAPARSVPKIPQPCLQFVSKDYATTESGFARLQAFFQVDPTKPASVKPSFAALQPFLPFASKDEVATKSGFAHLKPSFDFKSTGGTTNGSFFGQSWCSLSFKSAQQHTTQSALATPGTFGTELSPTSFNFNSNAKPSCELPPLDAHINLLPRLSKPPTTTQPPQSKPLIFAEPPYSLPPKPKKNATAPSKKFVAPPAPKSHFKAAADNTNACFFSDDHRDSQLNEKSGEAPKPAYDFDTSLAFLEKLIAYPFKDPNLAKESLFVGGQIKIDGRTILEGNKRLAIIGDAALKLAWWDGWFYSTYTRGQVSPHFCRITSNAHLADIGRRLRLQPHVWNESGTRYALGTWPMATTVEAIFGAVWLDSSRDVAAVKKVMFNLLGEFIL